MTIVYDQHLFLKGEIFLSAIKCATSSSFSSCNSSSRRRKSSSISDVIWSIFSFVWCTNSSDAFNNLSVPGIMLQQNSIRNDCFVLVLRMFQFLESYPLNNLNVNNESYSWFRCGQWMMFLVWMWTVNGISDVVIEWCFWFGCEQWMMFLI